MELHVSLSRKIAIGFSLALLILMAIGAVSYRSTVQFAESADVVARSHQIIAKLEATLGDLAIAESEARGFVISGNENHLGLYRRFANEVAVDIKHLRALAMDPTIKQRLATLEGMIQLRLDRLQTSIETRKLEGLEAASKLAGPGKKLMDEVRQAVDDIETLEKNLLDERHRVAKSLAAQTITVVVLGSFLAVLVAGASTIILRADITHRERLEKEVMEISEREQRRIGRDLHDGLCQRLTGIALFNRSLQQKLAAKSVAEADEARRVTELINSSIEEARRLTHGLQPVPDEPTGLMIALRELAASTQSLSKLACHLDCPETVTVPDRIAATHLYRIAQEALHNALRHAKASSIVIALRADENTVTLTVSDDGCGLPEHRPRKGLGLDIMDYRASAIGATLAVRRGEKRGTVVCCALHRDALSPRETTS
ncbi:MAG: CHASE3 domain-containing protein [Verrucomicrobia bacterium]|nr:CHASE3 domain-containing protein [Verrucomicrobiota bacterium]